MGYGSGEYGTGLYGISPAEPGLPLSVSPVAPEDYVVLVTDRYLNVVGDPIFCWTSLDLTLRFNEPSSGILVTPAYPWIREQFQPSHRVVVIRNGQVLIAGPWEQRLRERSDNGENAGVGRLTVHFADDLALLAAHNVYPDKYQPPQGQMIDYWEFSGDAEGALRTLAMDAAGAAALTDRRIPQLVLGTQKFIGSNVTVKAQRMKPWGDIAREIAQVGGGLGFQTRQVGKQILFEVYQPTDKSGLVRFGFSLGNLRYIAHETKAPTATAVAIGGQGEGADRYMIERLNAAEMALWGRFEKYVARAGSAAAVELEEEGDRALAEGAATERMTANVADTPDQRFGVHYAVGDIVAIETEEGEQIADVVRNVHIQVYATSGEYVAATIGNQAALTDPVWIKRVREIDERLGRIERAVTPG